MVVGWLESLAADPECVPLGEVVLGREHGDLVCVGDQQVLMELGFLASSAALRRMRWRTSIRIHELDIGDALIIFNLQLFYKFAHSQVPNVHVPIVTGAGEYLLAELVHGGDLVVVNIFEE